MGDMGEGDVVGVDGGEVVYLGGGGDVLFMM